MEKIISEYRQSLVDAPEIFKLTPITIDYLVELLKMELNNHLQSQLIELNLSK